MNQSSSSPLVSAIVVNYNGQRFLEKLFSSIQNQTYPHVEILCVDSGSTDTSVGFVRTRFPHIKLILSTNKGYGAGCNVGVKEALGQYVFFLNEDMYMDPEFIQQLVSNYQTIHQQDPTIGALACSHYHYEKKPRPSVLPGNLDIFSYPGPIKPPTNRGGFIPGSPFFMPRALFVQSGGFCPHIFLYNDDTDLSWRLLLMGHRQYSAPDVHIYHYDGASMPGFPPKKIYYFVYSTFICIFNNYSAPLIPVFFLLNLLYTVGAILPGLLIFSSNKLVYASAVGRAIYDFFRRVPVMFEFRRHVQSLRKISDWQFMANYLQLTPSLIATKSYKRL